jgi:YidC/Oxa1 family membrane protein insertase
MSSNQRLILAVVLSVIFFVGYTAIFPPAQPDSTTQTTASTNVQTASKTKTQVSKVDEEADHAISQKEKEADIATTNTILTVTNKNFILKMDTLGRISSKELLEDKFRDANNKHAQIIRSTGAKPLYLRFLDENLNKEASSTPYTASVSEITLQNSSQHVTLTQRLSNLIVTKDITFYTDGHYDVTVSLSKDKRYFIYVGKRPQVNKKEQMMTAKGALVYTDAKKLTIIEDGDVEGRKTFTGIELVASFDQYTTSMMYGFSKDTNVMIDRDNDSNPIAYFDALQTMKFHGYIGQKNYNTLHHIKPVLTHVIEYGWFTFASQPMFLVLSWLHGIFGNWGWSIIALTALIRMVLFPLTYKGMMSMQKMKALAPKLKELKAKYKKDPQKLNAMTMDMYKKHGANPLGGCLPMLMQIPVFYAIYRLLLNSVELQGAPWMLWVQDLSRMDPYYVMPILMGASMFLQQRMTPTNFTDPMQEKVMKYLPVIFTFFFVTFPSGLVLYWFTNNLFSIAQQFVVNQQFANLQDAQKALAKNDENKND